MGVCQVRRNMAGRLYSLSYSAICSAGVDPIEKKPLFQFYPGSMSFSMATVGCNVRCQFCQNWQISQLPRLQDKLPGERHDPEAIVASAVQHRCESISFTYTEPTVFMELCGEVGRRARQQGLKNVFVSNGFMTIEALEYAGDFLDAINVDLKAYTEEFYRNFCKAKLAPVLETLRYIARQTDIWLEVTTLVIPGKNDSEQELQQIAVFIAGELGAGVPWHISRFHPCYEMQDTPATPVETLEKAYELGRKAGLRYIYVGNAPGCGRENTLCHQCGAVLIERSGYQLVGSKISDGKCASCRTEVAGVGVG